MKALLNKLFISGLFIVLLTPLASANSDFPDVYDTHPVKEALDFLVDEEVVEGNADGTFAPLSLLNRAEYTKMVMVALYDGEIDEDEHQDCFPDVTDEWFAKYVCAAADADIITGYDSGEFIPENNITRAEAVKIIAGLLDWEAESIYNSEFWDMSPVEWWSDSLIAAEEHGVFDLIDSNISPHEYLQREQMAILLYRTMKAEVGEDFETWDQEFERGTSYQDILDTGIQPAYPIDMVFASNSQSAYPYGCYAFATKNLLEWKYDWFLDIPEVQDVIGWDGTFIWSPNEFSDFAKYYGVDVVFSYQASAEFLFKKLAMGQPLVLYIPYELNGVNIGHNLVAYSFDDDGVWVADSLSGGIQRHIGWDEVFFQDDSYTLNLTELRMVSGEGMRLSQVGI